MVLSNRPYRETDRLVLTRRQSNQNPEYKTRIWYLPIISILSLLIAIIVPYTISSVLHHIDPFNDYISAVDKKEPESAVFIVLIFLATVINAMMKFVLFGHISSKNPDLWFINTAGLSLGLTAVVSALLVESLPDIKVTEAHVTSAGTMFISEGLFQLVQTLITWKRRYSGDVGIVICVLRTLCNVVSIGMLLATLVVIALRNLESLTFEESSKGLVTLELIAPVSFTLYTLTFLYEFCKIEITFRITELVNS